MLDNNSIEVVYIENYEIQISRFNFTHIYVNFFKVSVGAN